MPSWSSHWISKHRIAGAARELALQLLAPLSLTKGSDSRLQYLVCGQYAVRRSYVLSADWAVPVEPQVMLMELLGDTCHTKRVAARERGRCLHVLGKADGAHEGVGERAV